jgi:poly(A) polymerase
LRAIGDPAIRFREDKLRLLRAVRIATRFDLTIEQYTEAAIRAMAPEIVVVSAERIAKELRELLVHPRRTRGVNVLLDLGLAAAILPEIVPMKGLPQGPPAAPTCDLWDHVMAVLDNIGPAPSFPLALATLLHDVGKPRTVGRTPDRYTFYYHEHVGARMTDEIGQRLKLSNAERELSAWLVEKHQYLCDAKQMRTSKLKSILSHPGIHELLVLHRADALAWGRSIEHVVYCEQLLSEWTEADLNPPPLITGHDLVRRRLQPGPQFKALLDAVREAQLDGTIKTPEQAWELIEKLRAQDGGESKQSR